MNVRVIRLHPDPNIDIDGIIRSESQEHQLLYAWVRVPKDKQKLYGRILSEYHYIHRPVIRGGDMLRVLIPMSDPKKEIIEIDDASIKDDQDLHLKFLNGEIM